MPRTPDRPISAEASKRRHQRIVSHRHAWMEEYKHCSCTFMARKKSDLMGYCPKHGNDRKYVIKLPAAAGMEMGYAGG